MQGDVDDPDSLQARVSEGMPALSGSRPPNERRVDLWRYLAVSSSVLRRHRLDNPASLRVRRVSRMDRMIHHAPATL